MEGAGWSIALLADELVVASSDLGWHAVARVRRATHMPWWELRYLFGGEVKLQEELTPGEGRIQTPQELETVIRGPDAEEDPDGPVVVAGISKADALIVNLYSPNPEALLVMDSGHPQAMPEELKTWLDSRRYMLSGAHRITSADVGPAALVVPDLEWGVRAWKVIYVRR